MITARELRIAGRYKESADISERVIQIAEELGDYKRVLQAMSNKVNSLFSTGDLAHAAMDLLRYERFCREHGSVDDFMLFYNLAGEFHGSLHHPERAKEYLMKSIALSSEILNIKNLGIAYTNLSHIYFMEGDYQQALHYALMSIQTLENCSEECKKENFMYQVSVQANLADAYTSLGQFDVAGEVLDKLILLPFLQKFERGRGITFLSLALWYEKQNENELAYETYQAAKEIFSCYGDIYLLKRVNKELLKLLLKMGNKEKLCEVQQDYIDIFETLEKENHSRILEQVDINEQQASYEVRVYQDPLTGIQNRAYIEEQAKMILKEASLNQQSVGCIIFDIDHFKYFNDEHGHLFGDEVIKLIANSAKDFFKQYDAVFARFGGDEFVAIVKYMRFEELYEITSKLHQSLCTLTIAKNKQSIPIYVSMGVSHNQAGKVTNYEELFHHADEALYQSKNSGRRRFTIQD